MTIVSKERDAAGTKDPQIVTLTPTVEVSPVTLLERFAAGKF